MTASSPEIAFFFFRRSTRRFACEGFRSGWGEGEAGTDPEAEAQAEREQRPGEGAMLPAPLCLFLPKTHCCQLAKVCGPVTLLGAGKQNAARQGVGLVLHTWGAPGQEPQGMFTRAEWHLGDDCCDFAPKT